MTFTHGLHHVVVYFSVILGNGKVQRILRVVLIGTPLIHFSRIFHLSFVPFELKVIRRIFALFLFIILVFFFLFILQFFYFILLLILFSTHTMSGSPIRYNVLPLSRARKKIHITTRWPFNLNYLFYRIQFLVVYVYDIWVAFLRVAFLGETVIKIRTILEVRVAYDLLRLHLDSAAMGHVIEYVSGIITVVKCIS